MVLLWLLATCRLAFVVAEQPRSSVMPWFPYIEFFKKALSQFLPWQEAFLSGAHVKSGPIGSFVVKKMDP
jgi:hypothetical protein